MQPLLQLIGLVREFDSGGVPVQVLKNINLSIMPGEMVAIVGASGSGKSTLMNILGCLDRASSGRYLVNGEDTAQMPPDELARLRREYFGFIFQRYHLLGDLSARENVAVPAVYAGQQPGRRLARADALLARLGLAERTAYRPSQLSGGQQQRVSIARALMNGGEVILADEPTGALDSKSGREVMQILQELHSEGHTVIIVTHDMGVARNCRRIIEIRDGEIIADNRNPPEENAFRQPETFSPPDSGESAEKPFRQPETPEKDTPVQMQFSGSFAALDRLREAAKMASISIIAHKMRSFLTMLGIIIGIASVVSVVALGNGSKEEILQSISSIGTNTLTIFPGVFGERRSGRIRTLTVADADFIAKQGFVDSVTPAVFKSSTLRYGNIAVNGQISGVGAQHFQVRGIEIVEGRGFDADDENTNATVAVIDQTAKETLFPDLAAQDSAIGRVILVNNMPVRVVAVGEADVNSNSSNLSVWMPYTTVMGRLLGQSHISNITVRLNDGVPAAAAEETITRILTQRHGVVDFSIMNSDSIRRSVEEAAATMTLLISMIAVISLIVGGIGVMNIMLVSVTERTQEIGVRMAVGARRSDILQQFLIEAVFICLIGGIGGILLALAFGGVFSHLSTDFPMIFSGSSMVSAFLCATAIGIVFGYLPARNAARLDPVAALSRE